MVKSTVKPEPIWVRRKDGLLLTLRARWNIETVEVEDMDGKSHTEYEYDEAEITHTVPNGITLDTISAYMKKQSKILIKETESMQVAPIFIAQPVKEKTLADMTVEDLRGIV